MVNWDKIFRAFGLEWIVAFLAGLIRIDYVFIPLGLIILALAYLIGDKYTPKEIQPILKIAGIVRVVILALVIIGFITLVTLGTYFGRVT